jgi:hypothetical protein
MTLTAPARRPSVAARRSGYLIAVAINTALLYLVNVQPGWQAVPFLTASTSEVIGLVNLSFAAGLAASLACLVHDSRWLKSLGDLVTAAIGIAVAAAVWQVFPFDFHGSSFDWAQLVRVLLIVAIVGGGIAVLVQAASLVRLAARRR